MSKPELICEEYGDSPYYRLFESGPYEIDLSLSGQYAGPDSEFVHDGGYEITVAGAYIGDNLPTFTKQQLRDIANKILEVIKDE